MDLDVIGRDRGGGGRFDFPSPPGVPTMFDRFIDDKPIDLAQLFCESTHD
jgi:hypothetical protein